jgi:hypothetical protein
MIVAATILGLVALQSAAEEADTEYKPLETLMQALDDPNAPVSCLAIVAVLLKITHHNLLRWQHRAWFKRHDGDKYFSTALLPLGAL